MPQSIRDHVSDIEDLGQDTVGAALSKDPMDALNAQAVSIGHGLQQGIAGFNEGLKNIFGGVADAVMAPQRGIQYGLESLTGTPHSDQLLPSQAFSQLFIDPAGAPQTKGQKLMRAGGNAVGLSVPTMFGGLGLATSGARSGISLAQQAASSILLRLRPQRPQA
jgi:hypothetical protein